MNLKVAVMELRLYAPWVHSLKEKRMVVKSLLGKIRSRYAVSAAETEEQDIYYSAIMSNDNWTRSLLLELESYLEKAFYTIDLGYSENKEIYKERIFREYFLLKDNEYMKYSSYLNQEEYDRLEELVMYGREKYNAYNSTEKTNNG